MRRLSWLFVRLWSALGTLLTLVGCAASPTLRGDTTFRVDALERKRIVVLPLAVSDDLGDQRTGIVLSDAAVRDSSAGVCAHLKDDLSDIEITCYQELSASLRATAQQALMHYALDQPIATELIRQIQKETSASFVLLFRPESVSAGKDVQKVYPSSGVVGVDLSSAIAGLITDAILRASTTPKEVVVGWTRAYSVSAALLDVRSEKIVRIGVHSVSSTERGNKLPNAAALLTTAMNELGEALLTTSDVAALAAKPDEARPAVSATAAPGPSAAPASAPAPAAASASATAGPASEPVAGALAPSGLSPRPGAPVEASAKLAPTELAPASASPAPIAATPTTSP